MSVLAFLAGRGSVRDDQASVEESSAEVSAPCVGGLGLDALGRGAGEAFLRTWFGVPPETRVEDFFAVERFECADLDGNRSDELVVQLVAGASGGATPWAIFENVDDAWEPVFMRHGPGGERMVGVRGQRVRTSTPSYAIGDPLCCPTGRRRGVLAFTQGDYVYVPDTGVRSRGIEVSTEGASSVAGIDLETLVPSDATQAFGLPSSVVRDGELCEMRWADIGLTINFANLGGDNPCSDKGAVGSAELEGPAGEQAGWHTEDGLRIGMPIEKMLDLYPRAQTSQNLNPRPEFGIRGRGYALKTKPSIIGEGTTAPSLIARIEDGNVVGIELLVGAAGE